MRVYKGIAATGEVLVDSIPLSNFSIAGTTAAQRRALQARNSHAEFNWGGTDTASRSLALSIFVHEYGAKLERHPVSYEEFLIHVICKFRPGGSFRLTSNEIRDWVVNRLADKKVEVQRPFRLPAFSNGGASNVVHMTMS